MKTIRIEQINRVALDVVLNNYIKATIINSERVIFSCLSGFAAQLKNELIEVFGEDYVLGTEYIEVTLPSRFIMEEYKTSITFYEKVCRLEVGYK